MATKRRALEINVPASTCDGGRYHTVGDLVTYRSALWMVKGLYIGTVRTGQSEVYYILSEASLSLEQLDDAYEG